MKPILRFVLVAVPGVLLFLFCYGWLTMAVFDRPEFLQAATLVANIAGIILGSLAILYGTNRWGKWLYLLVFLMLPFAFFGSMFGFVAIFGEPGSKSPLLIGGGLTIGLSVLLSRSLDRYYST